jgi:UDP-3-O-[3-hydroxymyristoyl] N-acetylglucosamine deacetylase
VVIDRFGVLNEGGLRFADEFVRHKVLDLLGDLALLGCSLLGHVQAHKSGHGQHLGLMKEIAAHPECWEFIELTAHGEDGILERMVNSTMAAGQRILPFLVPPATAFADGACPACSA